MLNLFQHLAIRCKVLNVKKYFSLLEEGFSERVKKAAFTLAEVLITLGIIGVVAAMTMPVLIQKHKNTVVETRLKKFYSAINQAILMSEAQYGPREYWYTDIPNTGMDSFGTPIADASAAQPWFDKYIGKFMNVVRYDTLSGNTFIVYFSDGSALAQINPNNIRDWVFFPQNPLKCLERSDLWHIRGVCGFAFEFVPVVADDYKYLWKYHINKGFEPWRYDWRGTEEELYQGCADTDSGAYCTAIIQNNGWKIPKDYPRKISY